MVFKRIVAFCLLVCSSVVIASVVANQPAPRDQSFVLLRNGNVLKGIVRAEKDRISVAVDGNSNLMLVLEQVAFVGPTLESLYQNQREGIPQWGTGEHWSLAHWCIQQGLIDHAIEHYQILEASASDSPRFKQLEYLLRQSLLADETVKQSIQKPTQSAASSNTTTSHPKSDANDVSQASASTHVESSESWNKHEIPGYIRKTFQNSILPVLVSRCGQAGCHGMLGKSDFHLYQPVGDQSANMLARDLDEVLRYVDRNRFQDSQLLAYATKAHGIQRSPSLNPSRDDERALVERIHFWIKSLSLSQTPASTMPAQFPATTQANSNVSTAVANVAVNKQTRSNSKLIGEVEQDRNAKLSKPAKSAPPTEFLSMSEIADLESAIAKFERQFNDGASGNGKVKKDPFDSESFNRAYR